jgi:5-methylthioribose kinase
MPFDTPAGYRPLTLDTVGPYLAAIPALRDRLGGEPPQWRVREVSDGYLNLVFAVEGPAGGLCVKQALPHVREAKWWTLPVERTFFENAFIAAVAPHVGALVPAVHHFDPTLFLIAMELLTPHIILRRELIAGRRYPKAAIDVAEFIARSTFFTSNLYLPFERKNEQVALFGRNHALLRITTDLVFTDPYRQVDRNRWTSPQLDDIAAHFRADASVKIAEQRFSRRFLSDTQALIHSDLHSGSVMVTESDTRIIDPEFGVYGPIGLDLGAFVGNLLISYFSQPGHAGPGDDRRAYQDWLLEQIHRFWAHFRAKFLELWRTNAGGDVFQPELFADAAGAAALDAERERFVDGLFDDMLGFAAIKMIRRIFSYAHVADFESIADPDRRGAGEAGALSLARDILIHPERYRSTGDLLESAARHAREPQPAGTRLRI